MLGMWWPRQKLGVFYNEILLTLIVVGFVMAVVFMIAYYMIWHPNVKILKELREPDEPDDIDAVF